MTKTVVIKGVTYFWDVKDKTHHPAVRLLWVDEGKSASDIGRMFGVSRSAVLGCVHRMKDIPGRMPQEKRPCPASMPRQIAKPYVPPPPEPELDAVRLEDGGHVTMLTVSDRTCRWPIGDVGDEDFHFCGHGPMIGSPYCEAHARKAHQKPLKPFNTRDYRPRYR